MMDVKKMAHDVQDFVIAFRRDLHAHPEASFEEFRTSDQICKALDEMGVPYRRLSPTGVIAEVKGAKPGKTVALRGDIDALSIQEKTDLPFASENDGFMHACGHDTHGAMLIGAVKVLNSIKDEFAGTVRFIFQPAEEIGKGAEAVIAQGGLEGVDAIFGHHIIAQAPVGTIAGAAGPTAAATDRFKITITGRACHGAMPHTGVDATVAASALVMNIQTMVSREFSPMDPLVVTVGSLHSGSRFNIISGEAVMEGTIRSFSREVHEKLPGVLERIAKETAATYRATAEVEYDSITDVLINDAEMTELGFEAAHKIVPAEMVLHQDKQMGGEDFAAYTACAPAAFYMLGGGGEYPQHSDHFTIEEAALETGVAFHVQVALDALEKLNK